MRTCLRHPCMTLANNLACSVAPTPADGKPLSDMDWIIKRAQDSPGPSNPIIMPPPGGGKMSNAKVVAKPLASIPRPVETWRDYPTLTPSPPPPLSAPRQPKSELDWVRRACKPCTGNSAAGVGTLQSPWRELLFFRSPPTLTHSRPRPHRPNPLMRLQDLAHLEGPPRPWKLRHAWRLFRWRGKVQRGSTAERPRLEASPKCGRPRAGFVRSFPQIAF